MAFFETNLHQGKKENKVNCLAGFFATFLFLFLMTKKSPETLLFGSGGEVNIRDALPQVATVATTVGTTLSMLMQLVFCLPLNPHSYCWKLFHIISRALRFTNGPPLACTPPERGQRCLTGFHLRKGRNCGFSAASAVLSQTQSNPVDQAGHRWFWEPTVADFNGKAGCLPSF